tara:strand:- start:471 stop:818 length:348 start_codon:yes stop_codon:yes gene_type:complete
MPQGKGTYGSKRGRPKKKRKGIVAKVKQRRSVTGKKRVGIKGTVKTKGGTYAKYKKGSKAAKSFNSAYAKAKPGTVFTWDGRKYKKPAAKKKSLRARVVGAVKKRISSMRRKKTK